MVRRRWAGSPLFVLVTMVLFAVSLPGSASAAQTTLDSCGQDGLTLSRVDVTSPRPGASVTAGPQKVSGRVGTGFTRVELFVDDELRDSKTLGQGGGAFELSWEATVTPARSANLLVVACGGGIAQIVRAATELAVTVTPAPTTTRPAGSTTVVMQTPTSNAAATTSTPSTVSATTAVAAGGGATTTVDSATTAPARVPQVAAAAVARTTTTRPRPATPPLVLSEQQSDDADGPPLWVGAVVGLGGIIGLLMSAFFSRRSAARAASAELPAVDPADDRSDLVSL